MFVVCCYVFLCCVLLLVCCRVGVGRSLLNVVCCSLFAVSSFGVYCSMLLVGGGCLWLTI